MGNVRAQVVERIHKFWKTSIHAWGRFINLGRILHAQGFMRTVVVVFFDEVIELGLLLEDILSGWTRSFFLQRQMHAFMATILLRMCANTAHPALVSQHKANIFGPISQFQCLRQ